MEYLPEDRTLVRPAKSLGEAMAWVSRKIAPIGTAKAVQRRWGIDPHTAEKIPQGVTSATTLVKAVKAEGPEAWALWDAIGELIIGESRDQFEERQLQSIIEETELARTRLEDRRHRRLALEGRTGSLGEMADR